MSGRAAIVTGGSSGIGLAIAGVLGERGYSVTLASRRVESLMPAAEGLRRAGFEVDAVAVDLSREEDVESLVRGHRERFGRLDVLVNNAGLAIAGMIAGQSTKALDLQLDVNLRAVYLVTRECLPMLREAAAEHRKAIVVNMASITGKSAWQGLAAYSATKFAIVAFSQALHKEHSSEGVHATAICPGLVDTAMTDQFEQWIPKQTMMAPEDVAGAVAYLLSTSPGCVVPELQLIRPGDDLP